MLIGIALLMVMSCSDDIVDPGNWEKFYPVEEDVVFENVVDEPIDKGASATTRKLYTYLRNRFGKNILLGDGNMTVKNKIPKLTGYDLMFYTQGYIDAGDEPEDGIPYRIDWYKSHLPENNDIGGIITLHWHWYAPKDGASFYYRNSSNPNGTKFDVSKAVIPGTEEYDLIIRDIDDIAKNLKRFADEDIPVLFRPLHEAGGNNGLDAWFWWGAKGPEACLKLWDILYDRLTNYHNLHNLLWVWSCPLEDWYPGDDKVDILGYDSYPAKYDYSSQKMYFDRLYRICGGRKMIAMTENGAIPDIENCFRDNAPWLYFMTWWGFLDTDNDPAHIEKVLSDERLITIEQ